MKRKITSIRGWRALGSAIRLIIPREIVAEIHNRSQGIPRLINAISDNLLLTAFAMECKTATLEMLDEVTADMRLEPCEKPCSRSEKSPVYLNPARCNQPSHIVRNSSDIRFLPDITNSNSECRVLGRRRLQGAITH